MRRRLLLATILAVAVAVILLGVPLAIFGSGWVRQGEDQRLQERLDGLVATVEAAQEDRVDVPDEALLQAAAGVAGDPHAFVMVVLPDGTVYTGGIAVEGPANVVTEQTDLGAEVSLTTSQWGRWLQSAQVTVLVTGLGVLALAAGSMIARAQAQRVSAPLVYLAASAEQLGAGQVRPQMAPTGIEEIDQVAAELARSSDRLAARLEAERQFTADARHQMRTPLTALSMRLEEIQLISDDEEVREEARIALDQVDRLVGVVDDLLAASRQINSGSTEAVTVANLTRQLGEEWAPSFARAGRSLVIDVPDGERVWSMPGQLSQILATLIENSLRHGAGTTTVRLRSAGTRIGAGEGGGGGAVGGVGAGAGGGGGVGAGAGGGSGAGGSPDHGSMTTIEVADEGPGVADEIAGRIFERGVTTGGTGLGLALARNLAVANGGRLELAQRRPPVFALFLASVPKSEGSPLRPPTTGSNWTGGPA